MASSCSTSRDFAAWASQWPEDDDDDGAFVAECDALEQSYYRDFGVPPPPPEHNDDEAGGGSGARKRRRRTEIRSVLAGTDLAIDITVGGDPDPFPISTPQGLSRCASFAAETALATPLPPPPTLPTVAPRKEYVQLQQVAPSPPQRSGLVETTLPSNQVRPFPGEPPGGLKPVLANPFRRWAPSSGAAGFGGSEMIY